MHDVMRFWLRKGVDGFRVDVIWHLIKDDQFRNNPVNPGYAAGMPPHQSLVPLYTADLPAVQDIVNGLRRVIDEFADRLLIGEIYLPIERLVTYYGCDLEGLHLPFNFALLHAHWDARTVSTLIDEYEAVLPAGGWPNWVLENHDHARIASRIGNAQARIAAMLLLTLRGTPTISTEMRSGCCRFQFHWSACATRSRKRSGNRSRPRWRADADAMGRQRLCRVLDSRALATHFHRLPRRQRRETTSRAVLNLPSLWRLILARRQHSALSAGGYRAS
jgi:hypothetical protein